MSNVTRFFSAPSPILLILFMGLGFGVSGCGLDASSDSADLESGPAAGIPTSEFEPVSFRALAPDDPGFWREKTATAKYDEPKPRTVTESISAEGGGQLLLDWEIKDENGVTGSKVKAEIKIFPGALEEDAKITIGLLNPTYAMVSVELEFGDHGTQFHIPAEVSLDMEGLDLSGYDDGDTLDFYWRDPVTDAWFPVPRDEDHFEFDRNQGKIKGIWFFKHFSRYSLSKGR